jgi:signal transduction histidine kinase
VLDTELRGFTGLVVDLLDISRMEAGAAELELAAVRPHELVRDVLDSTQREQVRVHVAPSAPAVVMIDRRRIARALMNLLDNADAYAKGAVSVLVTGDQHVLRLCVDDHGPGVPVDEREYVFDRFARGRSSSDTHGTGLGLALVVEHVRLHGGRVWVEDAPGGGARFVVQVPKDGS